MSDTPEDDYETDYETPRFLLSALAALEAENARLREVVDAARKEHDEDGGDYCYRAFPPPVDCECGGCTREAALTALDDAW